MSETYITRLSKFTTCDVADGLQNLYGIANGGYFPNLIQRSVSPTKQTVKSVVGRAYTVLFVSSEDPAPQVNYIDSIPKDAIVVMAYTSSLQMEYPTFTPVDNAIFGGLMASRAQYLGAKGTVVFGRVRDVDEFRSLKYPVFSYGLGACASKNAVKPIQTNGTLSIRGTKNGFNSTEEIEKCTTIESNLIKANDFIICDEHGMVRIPYESVDLDYLIKYIEKSIEVDGLVSNDIISGKPAEQSKKERRALLEDLLKI